MNTAMQKRSGQMIKKALAVFLAVLVALPIMGVSVSATDEKNYIITDPYADVDWDTWGA